jgi:2-phospho-L-lactate guanylyltransferase
MNLWLLIPVNFLREGKSRLGSVLNPAARHRLNVLLLNHTIKVAREFPGLERTAIVSADDDVLVLAAASGATGIRHGASLGLNASIAHGVTALRDRADQIMIVPVDLPLLTATDLRRVAATDPRYRIVLCPDRRRSGTNCMLLRGITDFDFEFGERSFDRHWYRSIETGNMPFSVINEHIAFDIDSPEDLEEFKRTRRFKFDSSAGDNA